MFWLAIISYVGFTYEQCIDYTGPEQSVKPVRQMPDHFLGNSKPQLKIKVDNCSQILQVFKNITFKISILFLYNHSSLLFVNTQYAGATPIFDIKVLHLVTNIQLLKHLLQ